MMAPDYSTSIVNLVTTIVGSLGGRGTDYPPLGSGTAGMSLTDRPIVLLIIDGLGDLFLQNFPDSFLCRHRQGRLSSVFPTTTATAVTSFFTGVGPQQHAITGWHTYFKELGAVSTVLPFRPRYGGTCFSGEGISPARLVDHPSLLDSLEVACHVILPNQLVDSVYSRTLCGRAGRHAYDSAAAMFAAIRRLTVPGCPALVVAYWPEFDHLAHSHGVASEEVTNHFLLLDRACVKTLGPLAKSGVSVMVTADHGLIDTCEHHTIHLEEHPDLAATLTLPLCGEPRCAYCYVRADRVELFERYVEDRLGFACDLRKSVDLVCQGFFGRGPVSPRLAERVGEYVLLMKDDYIIRDRLLTEKPSSQVGVHGGLSAEELYVPLIVL